MAAAGCQAKLALPFQAQLQRQIERRFKGLRRLTNCGNDREQPRLAASQKPWRNARVICASEPQGQRDLAGTN
jgi:hypothetical protein